MEAIIILGIIGTGYILNDSKENNDTIDGELTPELQLPTHNNVYDTNNYDESKGIQLTTANELLNNNKNVYNITNVDIGVDRLMGLSDTVISKSTKLEKEYYTMLVNAFQFTMKMNDLSNYNNLSDIQRNLKQKQYREKIIMLYDNIIQFESNLSKNDIENINTFISSLGNDGIILLETFNAYKNGGINKLTEIVNNYDEGLGFQAQISPSDFLRNNQGYVPQPETNGNNPIQSRFEEHMGGYAAIYKKNKTENEPLFNPFEYKESTVGNNLYNPDDTSRYNLSTTKHDVRLPNTNQYVQPISKESSINNDIGRLVAETNSIDNRRNLLNRQQTYNNRLIPGKSLTSKPGIEPIMQKYDPPSYYKNSPSRNFVTTGTIIAPTEKSEYILPETNRHHLNKNELSNPTSNVNAQNAEIYSNVMESTNQQLKSDTIINTTGPTAPNIDYKELGYEFNPNEREITCERTYEGNIKGTEQSTLYPNDGLKPTLKDTIIYNRKGNISTGNKLPIMGIQDNISTTLKDTLLFNHDGNIAGNKRPITGLQDEMKNTIKQGTLQPYTPDGISYIPAQTNQYTHKQLETNPTREIISKNRSPNQELTKLTNGVDTLNTDIKKIDNDYMTNTTINPDKVYQVTNNKSECEITTNKMKYNDAQLLLNQIDPKLLDPFRSNPYTHSLTESVY